MNGYGAPPNTRAALEKLVEAYRNDYPIARAYMYRIFTACGEQPPSDVSLLDDLNLMAINGSRMALMDLAILDPNAARLKRNQLRNHFCSVGAIWYYEGQWLHGLNQERFFHQAFSMDRLGSSTDLPQIVVNLRGDGLIHAAAATRASDLLQKLLLEYQFDVNQQNRHGETALLCATRAGHPRIVKLLLDHGARASIQAKNGEAPLHWLRSFEEPVMSLLGKDLIERGGALVDACTTCDISHSSFPGHMDVDNQVAGPPLLWAVWHNRIDVVSFLLSMGGEPQQNFRGTEKRGWSPLVWAAGLHHTECLDALISHVEARAQPREDRAPDHVLYAPVVRVAIGTSDKFSMIIRHGVRYLHQLESTLRLIHEKTRNFRMLSIDGEHDTAIGYAASQGHDEAVEILLKIGWGDNEINQPDRLHGRTPILDAVRWNRNHLVDLLLRHGADPQAMARNPFDPKKHNWSALHIFAEQAHNDDFTVAEVLLNAGVPVDGRHDEEVETPLYIAIRRNSFKLADFLLSKGADVNALSTRSSLIVSDHPLTGLGHITALNARYCIPSLRYLLGPHADVTTDTVNFIVDPTRYLSVLHLCALVPDGLRYTSGDPLSRKDFDYETNSRITHELLDWFRGVDYLEKRCSLQGRTALHLATQYGNVGAVKELVDAGADVEAVDDGGLTAAQIARSVYGEDEKMVQKLLGALGWSV